MIQIIGSDRSGTTLLAKRISKYSNKFIALPEAQWLGPLSQLLYYKMPLEEAVEYITKTVYIRPWEENGIDIKSIISSAVKEHKNIHKILRYIFAKAALSCNQINNLSEIDKKIIIEHTPWSYKYLRYIDKYVPLKDCIHIVRDGRDVALSLKKMHWGPNTFYTASIYWANSVVLCEQKVEEKNGLTIKYEEFINNEKSVIKNIYNRINIQYEENSSNKKLIRFDRGRYSKQHRHTNSELINRNCNKWKQEEVKAFYMHHLSSALLVQYGYENNYIHSEWSYIKHVVHKMLDRIINIYKVMFSKI